jgi:hypothetical protein
MAKGLYSYTMIEQIKELVEGMTVYCDDNEDIVVSVKILTDEDENDFVIVELETSYLIANNSRVKNLVVKITNFVVEIVGY